MRVEVVSVHPLGLSPAEAAKAWYMRVHQKRTWADIRASVTNVQGETPGSKHVIENAVKRMALSGGTGIAKTGYAQCGRRFGADGGKNKLPETEAAKVVEYVIREEVAAQDFLRLQPCEGRVEVGCR